jgi:hypothetical protein
MCLEFAFCQSYISFSFYTPKNIWTIVFTEVGRSRQMFREQASHSRVYFNASLFRTSRQAGFTSSVIRKDLVNDMKSDWIFKEGATQSITVNTYSFCKAYHSSLVHSCLAIDTHCCNKIILNFTLSPFEPIANVLYAIFNLSCKTLKVKYPNCTRSFIYINCSKIHSSFQNSVRSTIRSQWQMKLSFNLSCENLNIINRLFDKFKRTTERQFLLPFRAWRMQGGSNSDLFI